jgi:hypothetical protein
MNRNLSIFLTAIFFVGLTVGPSFALSLSFSDTEWYPNQAGWTHILEDLVFTPSLVAGDTISVTDALLEIQMDYRRAGTGGTKLFQVTASGDMIQLATFSGSGSAREIDDALWSIDLDTLSNAATVLQAINDRSFAVALSVGTGSINNIDFARLSGNATVVQADPIDPDPIDPINVPEPSTAFLLAAGLAGVGFLRKKI